MKRKHWFEWYACIILSTAYSAVKIGRSQGILQRTRASREIERERERKREREKEREKIKWTEGERDEWREKSSKGRTVPCFDTIKHSRVDEERADARCVYSGAAQCIELHRQWLVRPDGSELGGGVVHHSTHPKESCPGRYGDDVTVVLRYHIRNESFDGLEGITRRAMNALSATSCNFPNKGTLDYFESAWTPWLHKLHWQEKSIDVSFISILCLVCTL